MNKTRAGKLSALRSEIEGIRAKLEIEKDDESEAFENLGDKAREGEKGLALEAAVEALDNALNSLEEALAYIEEAEGQIV